AYGRDTPPRTPPHLRFAVSFTVPRVKGFEPAVRHVAVRRVPGGTRGHDAGRRCTASAAHTVLPQASSSTTSAPVGWMSTTRQYRDRPPVISNLTSRPNVAHRSR